MSGDDYGDLAETPFLRPERWEGTFGPDSRSHHWGVVRAVGEMDVGGLGEMDLSGCAANSQDLSASPRISQDLQDPSEHKALIQSGNRLSFLRKSISPERKDNTENPSFVEHPLDVSCG